MNENCANCGKLIGKLETPRVWKESIVCSKCWTALDEDENPKPIVKAAVAQIVEARAVPPVPAQRPAAERVVIVREVHQAAPSPPLARAAEPRVVVVHAPPSQPAAAPIQHVSIQTVVHGPPAVKPPKRAGVLATLAVIFGAMALLGAWVPVLGMLAMPFAVIAVVLGILGFLLNVIGGASLTRPIAGAFLGIVAIGLQAVVTSAFSAAAKKNGAAPISNPPAARSDSSPSTPKIEQPTKPVVSAVAPTESNPKPAKFSQSQEERVLLAAVKSATDELAAARAKAEEDLMKDSSYAGLIRARDRTDKERKNAATPEARITASGAYIKYRNEADAARSAAIEKSADVKAAQAKLEKAQAELAAATRNR